MSDAGDGGERNADLEAMHRELVALVASLERAVDDADRAQIRVLDEQIAETNKRQNAVHAELFAARTEAISVAAHSVSTSIPVVEAALADLRNLDAFVAGMTATLALVDHAVETARMASGPA